MNTNPALLGIGTSVPSTRYTQSELLDQLASVNFGQNRRTQLLFGRAGVNYRHIAADARFYTENHTTQTRNDRYLQEAMPLAEAAICRCLDETNLSPEAIDDFLVVSCTGFDIPGLDLRLAGRLGMRPDLRRTCVLGMGCYAAFPALLRAREAASYGQRLTLVLTLELCSLHFQFEDTDENVVSTALFADGASAALISPPECLDSSITAPRLIDSATHCDYQTIEHMAFHLTDHGFQMRLSSYVPDLLAAKCEAFVDRLLKRNDLRREEVRLWGIHPGGRKILDYLQACLGLNDEQMKPSRKVLANYGNMSSATILFVLNELQQTQSPQRGEFGLLLGFGPGLTSEGILLQW